MTRTDPMRKLYDEVVNALRLPQLVEWLSRRRLVQRLGNNRAVTASGWPVRKLFGLFRPGDDDGRHPVTAPEDSMRGSEAGDNDGR